MPFLLGLIEQLNLLYVCDQCRSCFKQTTAYEMRSSDWSSDVCSADLRAACRSGAPSAPPRPMGTTPNQSSLHCCQKCAEHKLRDPIRGCLPDVTCAPPTPRPVFLSHCTTTRKTC